MTEAVEEPVIAEPSLGDGAKMKKWIMRIAALVVVLMVGEAAALYFLLGSGGEGETAEDDAAADIANGLADITAGSDIVEIPLEPGFAITNATADLGTLVHVNFDLVAGVSAKNEAVFRTAVETDYRSRLRQAVSEIARSAALEELQDPDLNQLKRRIKEDLNKTLQSSYVVEVIIPKIQVHVQ